MSCGGKGKEKGKEKPSLRSITYARQEFDFLMGLALYGYLNFFALNTKVFSSLEEK